MSSSTLEVAVVTVSDSCSRGERVDQSGPAAAKFLQDHGFTVAATTVVPDEQAIIQKTILDLAAKVELVVTTGGTGIAARDVTPEATRAVCGRLIEGIPEKMRLEGGKKTRFAVLSRGVCGVCGRALVLNLPGSPKGAVQSLEAVVVVLPHVVQIIAGHTDH